MEVQVEYHEGWSGMKWEVRWRNDVRSFRHAWMWDEHEARGLAALISLGGEMAAKLEELYPACKVSEQDRLFLLAEKIKRL